MLQYMFLRGGHPSEKSFSEPRERAGKEVTEL